MRLKIKGTERFHIPMDMPDARYYKTTQLGLVLWLYRGSLHVLGKHGVSTCFIKVQHARWGELGLKFPLGEDSIDPAILLERQTDGYDMDLAPQPYGMASLILWYPDGHRLELPAMLTGIARPYTGRTDSLYNRMREHSSLVPTYEERERSTLRKCTDGRYTRTREWYDHRTYRRTVYERECSEGGRCYEGDDEFNEFYDRMEDEFGHSAVSDLHSSNCGWWDNHIVCIDWGWDAG